jgi:glycosyl transferase family 87
MSGRGLAANRFPGAGPFDLPARLQAIADRMGPARMRAVRHALIIVGLISLPYIIVINQAHSMFGFDAHAYWAVDLSNLYGNSSGNTSDLDAFRYTPAAGQAFSVFGVLPWEAFFAAYFAAMIAALVWMTGRTWLVLLAFPPIPLELYHGNIHLFMAVAIVVGFRYPMAWAFIVLTKVTPGVGALWFAFRREWRLFAIAVLSTVLIAAISYMAAPDLWRQYVATMVDNLDYDPGHPYPIPIPLPFRIALAVAVVWWGARTDRRWTVPVAATIALPIIWFHGLAVLVAAIPLWRQDRIRRAPQAAGGAAGAAVEGGAERAASRHVDVAQAASGRNSIGA